MKSNRLIIIAISLLSSGVLLAFDQFTKAWAVTNLEGRGIVNVFGDYIILIFARNRGAFLGMGDALPSEIWYLGMVIIPVLALLGFCIWMVLRAGNNIRLWVFWSLVFSGGAGNLIDRILNQKVIDFMNIGIEQLRTGIFNVADLYLVFALIWFVFAKPFPKITEPHVEQSPSVRQ